MKRSLLGRNGRGKFSKTKRALARAANSAKETFIHAPGKMTIYVKRNPYKSFGYTMLAGLVLSQLVRLRQHHR